MTYRRIISLVIVLSSLLTNATVYAENPQIQSASIYYIGMVEGGIYKNIKPVVGFSDKSFSLEYLPYCETINGTNLTEELIGPIEDAYKRLYESEGHVKIISPARLDMETTYSFECSDRRQVVYYRTYTNRGNLSFYFDGMRWFIRIDLFENQNITDSELNKYIVNAKNLYGVFFSSILEETFKNAGLKAVEKLVVLNIRGYNGSFSNCTPEMKYTYFNQLDCPSDREMLDSIFPYFGNRPVSSKVKSIEDLNRNFHVIYDESYFIRKEKHNGYLLIYSDSDVLRIPRLGGCCRLLSLINYMDFFREYDLVLEEYEKIGNKQDALKRELDNLESVSNRIVNSESRWWPLSRNGSNILSKTQKELLTLQENLSDIDGDIEKLERFLENFNTISSDTTQLYSAVYKNKIDQRTQKLSQDIESLKGVQSQLKDRTEKRLRIISDKQDSETSRLSLLINLVSLVILLGSLVGAVKWLLKRIKERRGHETTKPVVFYQEKKCMRCDGTGKIKCHCDDGYQSPNLPLGSHSANLIKNGDDYILKISGISAKNEGIGGNATLRIKVKDQHTGTQICEHSKKMPVVGSEINSFDEEFDLNLGNLNELKDLMQREPKLDDFYTNVSFGEYEPTTKHQECDGTGFLVCPICKGEKKIDAKR